MAAQLKEAYRQDPTSGTVLFWSDDERRYGFKNTEQIFYTRTIEAGSSPLALGSNPIDLTDVPYTVDGTNFTLADFIGNPANIGLLVVQNGDVIFERYASGNDSTSRWVSFSVTKSLTSMLIGCLLYTSPSPRD